MCALWLVWNGPHLFSSSKCVISKVFTTSRFRKVRHEHRTHLLLYVRASGLPPLVEFHRIPTCWSACAMTIVVFSSAHSGSVINEWISRIARWPKAHLACSSLRKLIYNNEKKGKRCLPEAHVINNPAKFQKYTHAGGHVNFNLFFGIKLRNFT